MAGRAIPSVAPTGRADCRGAGLRAGPCVLRWDELTREDVESVTAVNGLAVVGNCCGLDRARGENFKEGDNCRARDWGDRTGPIIRDDEGSFTHGIMDKL